jgi:hypothetical protein
MMIVAENLDVCTAKPSPCQFIAIPVDKAHSVKNSQVCRQKNPAKMYPQGFCMLVYNMFLDRHKKLCCSSRFFVFDDDFFYFITLADLVNYLQAFYHFPKAGMLAVQVSRIPAAVANEKLGAAGIPSGMCHRKHASVVVLVAAC